MELEHVWTGRMPPSNWALGVEVNSLSPAQTHTHTHCIHYVPWRDGGGFFPCLPKRSEGVAYKQRLFFPPSVSFSFATCTWSPYLSYSYYITRRSLFSFLSSSFTSYCHSFLLHTTTVHRYGHIIRSILLSLKQHSRLSASNRISKNKNKTAKV